MANKHLRAVGNASEAASPAFGTPDDAKDFESLWIDPQLGDGITTETFHTVTVDKPKSFFRTHPDPAYRRRTELYTHKVEGVIGEQHFIVAPSMRGLIDGARPCTLVCVIYRDGSPRLWPIKFPKDGEKDNSAWISARSAAKAAMEKWLRITWAGGAYQTRAAIWCVDTEFYPGTGRANGGRNGDPITPHCLVALEMRSGRTVRLRPDEFGPFPPYRLDSNALFIAFANTAEYGVHVQRKWGQPACAIDAYVEFRHYVNDGRVKSGEREKGFYGLGGALRFFCDDCIDAAHKDEMRDQILRGPPFDAAAVDAHVQYCEEDTRALARLVPHIVPTIRSLPHAMLRADFQWASALHEQRGIPIDLPKFERIRDRWDGIQLDLVREHDRFGIYEIVDGKPHWREHRFADFVRQNRWSWPTRADGSLDQRDETFKQMGGRYRHVETLRELRYSMSKLRLNDLAVGNDGRCRTPLWAYGTKTARNAPSNSQYIFGPAKWVRFLITPPPGRVLVHRDFKQQEVRIAAILSGDAALLQACESGDVYLGIAEQLGFVRDSMSPVERRAVRALFKTVVLGIQYGLGAVSLAVRTGISLVEACEILARLKARFHVFEAWAASVADHAGLDLEIGTPLGWYMQTPPGINSRTVRNFPIQATAAEVLHVACILAERRGIEIIAPVHDALMAEGPIDRAEELSIALDRVMRDAAAIVLRGYELPTDTADLGGPIFPGQHFFDERGAEMWKTVTRLAAKQEERWA